MCSSSIRVQSERGLKFCVFCNQECEYTELIPTFESNDCPKLNANVHIIFILRRMLDLPQELCVEYLKTFGEHPSTWFTTCLECSELVRSSWNTYRQIQCFEKDMVRVRKEIRMKVVQSEGERQDDKETNFSRPRTELIIREAIVNLDGLSEVVPKFDVDQEFRRSKEQPKALGVALEAKKEESDNEFRDLPSDSGSWHEDNPDFSFGKKRTMRFQKSRRKMTGIEDRLKKAPKAEVNDNSLTEAKGKQSRRVVKINRLGMGKRKNKSAHRSPEIDNPGESGNRTKPEFQCSKCPAAFIHHKGLLQHENTHERSNNNGNEFDCKQCGFPCESLQQLQLHISIEHEMKIDQHICSECGFVGRRRKYLEQHVREKHPDRATEILKIRCDMCNESFFSLGYLTRHKRAAHSELFEVQNPGFVCDFCGLVAKTIVYLRGHIQLKHCPKKVYCDVCGVGCSSRYQLKRHLSSHKEEKQYKCNLCGLDYTYSYSLDKHMRTCHNNEDRNSSPVPESEIKTQESSSNSKSKSFTCRICNSSLSSRALLLRHSQTHTEALMKCDQCDKSYVTEQSLKRHKVLLHSGETVFCPYNCGRKFPHKQYLPQHFKFCAKAKQASGNDYARNLAIH